MGKRVTPLRAGRADARPWRNFLDSQKEPFLLPYPFHEISPNLEVRISNQAKRMALRLDARKRTVRLVVPGRAALQQAYRFARDNESWIQDKLASLPRPIGLEDGSVLPVFGQDRQIVILYNKALKCTDIQLKRKEILVLTNKEDPSARIKRFLMDTAEERLSALAAIKAAKIRRRIKDITIKDTRSRWGSCSDTGQIALSWRLMFAPVKAMDYVVAHEVAHLVHMDHSDNFWRVCEKLCRDYETGRVWMRDNGNELMRYG